MTKKWTALLLAAVLAVGLSACDTSRAEAPGSNLESGVSAIEDDLFVLWAAQRGQHGPGLAGGDLPPTFYVYGTEDPFYRQFQQQYDVIRNMGISTGRIVLNGWPHGFGSDGGWVNDYAAWLESVFANKEES